MVAASGAERVADHRLPGDRECVERERQQEEDRRQHLGGGEHRGAVHGRDHDGADQGHSQAERAEEDPAPGAQRREHTAHPRTDADPEGAGRPQRDRDAGHGHPGLRDRGAGRRPDQAPAEPVDQQRVERDVGGGADRRDDERGAGVLHPAEQPGRGDRDEHARQTPGRDPQVVRGGGRDGGLGAEQRQHRCREQPGGHAEGDADPEREPQPVEARPHRARGVAGAEPARDRRRRRVGEEDHQPDRRLQGGGREAERGQRVGAEVPDHRRVGREEDRLGDERPQRRQGEPRDLPVEGAAGGVGAAHGSSVGAGCDDDRGPEPLRKVVALAAGR